MTEFDEKRIEAYLNQEMPAAEKKAFEAEMSVNETLRIELGRHRVLNAALAAHQRQKLRTLALKTRTEMGAIPEPSLSFFDRLRYYFYLPYRIYLLLAALLTAGFFLSIQFLVTPVPELATKYFLEPKNPFIAGTAPVVQQSAFNRAAEFYWSGQPDSLMRMAATAPGKYYLAHWYLSHRAFDQAETFFAQTLVQRQALEPELQDWGKIKFNHLLAALGAGESRQHIRAELKALLQDEECEGDTRSNAESLLRDLKNPLRLFTLR